MRHTDGVRPADIAALFDHLYWVRDRVLVASDDPAAPFIDQASPTLRDLRTTLVHELDVEWSWRERLAGPDPTSFSADDEDLVATDFANVAAIRDRWATDEAAMRTWLASLDKAALAASCRAEESGGRHPLWFHLQHLYSHAIQQFADAAVVLTAAGRSPGELDFLQFVEDRERSAGS
jgi:DinB family.